MNRLDDDLLALKAMLLREGPGSEEDEQKEALESEDDIAASVAMVLGDALSSPDPNYVHAAITTALVRLRILRRRLSCST